jgi:hypothetical protein
MIEYLMVPSVRLSSTELSEVVDLSTTENNARVVACDLVVVGILLGFLKNSAMGVSLKNAQAL